MKLVLFNTLLISFAGTVCGQRFQQEPFSFPPQFQTPSSTFTSDSSIYLPLESNTPIPYFTMSDLNKLPFQLLPSTGTKAPPMYPTSLPIYLSSTLKFEDEENENDDDEISNNSIPIPKGIPQNHINRANNNTMKPVAEKRDGKFNLRVSNQQPPHHKYEVKPPTHITVRPNDMTQPKSQNPASRRMIITSEIQRAEQSPDQMKASSFHNSQYVQAPGVFISSTTEPAIPILRLSNEMDLDGSFSYEALGADQTHYVQHSRMENMGTDKEEQVVEGSYSYIGDDGRTYTVHYIADSNGFRATGDHLPVSPPIPEIIQRAVQYNLAEEAKKPPHLRASWENEEKEYETNERNIYNNPPPRNLFTGKTPEAFSFGFSQGSNTPNNLATSASFQVPAKSNYEISIDQSKAKVNTIPILPQITFLASQGAHNPSTQTQPPTKVVNSEKSPLPQIMNYEAEIKDSDQEASKALWRWQYGLNTNTHQNPKSSISRSFGEGDDVIINFSDMTPDQYTHMMQTQILPQNTETPNNIEYNIGDIYQSSFSKQNFENKTSNIPEQLYVSTEIINLYTQEMDEMEKNHNKNNVFQEQTYKEEGKSIAQKENLATHPEIISRQSFIPRSQIATQSYDFDNISFEPSKITTPNKNSRINVKAIYKISDNDVFPTSFHDGTSTLEPIYNTVTTTSRLNFASNEENSSFRPIIYSSDKEIKQESTTTDTSMNEMIRENMFLRNLFKPQRDEKSPSSKPIIENNKQENNKNQEIKQDKETKNFQYQENPQNAIKIVKSKPLDVNNILNYIVMKNHFESIKTKQKNKSAQHFNQNMNVKDMTAHYIPIKETSSYDLVSNNDDQPKQDYDYKTLNQQQQQDLQGLIKNYKVLQRQRNTMQRNQLLSEPQKHIKAFHTQSLPPLGRAGPSMKSYLPPTYL